MSGFSDTTYSAVTGLAYDETNKKLGLKVGADTVIPFNSGTDVEICVIGSDVPSMVIDSSGVKLGTLTVADVSFLSAITYNGNNRAMGLTLAKDGYYGELGYARQTLTNTPTYYTAGTVLPSATWIGTGNWPVIFYMTSYTP